MEIAIDHPSDWALSFADGKLEIRGSDETVIHSERVVKSFPDEARKALMLTRQLRAGEYRVAYVANGKRVEGRLVVGEGEGRPRVVLLLK